MACSNNTFYNSNNISGDQLFIAPQIIEGIYLIEITSLEAEYKKINSNISAEALSSAPD